MHYYYSSPLSLLRCLPHFVFSPAVFFFFFRSQEHFSSVLAGLAPFRSPAPLRLFRATADSYITKKRGEGGKKTAKEGRKEERRDNGFPSRCLPRGRSRQAGRQAVGRRADDRSGCSGNSTLLGELRCSAHQDKKRNQKNIFSK